MTIHEYFSDVVEELKRRSDRVRLGFSTHVLSAGENRESIVSNFLREYLPKAYGVDTGLILAKSGEFSNQADVVVVDQTYNAPLFSNHSNRLWLIESVYALIEVKTTLSPNDISDSLKKCRKFKTMPRDFETVPELPRIPDSLFVLWAFEAPKPETAKENIVSALKDVPRSEQPDFIVVPDLIIATAGSFRELSKLGMPGSLYRQQLIASVGEKLDAVLGEPIEVFNLEKNTLLAWLIWVTSWLKGAGHRSAPLKAYLAEGHLWGQRVP